MAQESLASQDGPPELPFPSTGRTPDLHSPGVEVSSERLHRRIEHQPAIGGNPPQHRPMRHRAVRVPAPPQGAAHDAASPPVRAAFRRSPSAVQAAH